VPLRNFAKPSLGRVAPGDANHELYQKHLRRTVEESFALFLSV
jgi:hypothetical protein